MRSLIKNIYLAARGLLLGLVPYMRPPEDRDVRSILFIRIDRLGDIIMSLPAMEAFRAIYPASRISVLVKKEFAPIFRNIPYIDEVIDYGRFLPGLIRLRRKRFDMAVDLLMDYTLKTALLARLCGARIRIGFDIESRGRLFNIPVKSRPAGRNMAENVMDLARSAARLRGAESAVPFQALPKLFITESESRDAEALLDEIGIRKNQARAGFHPGAKFASQRWGARKFAELADRISSRHGAGIIIFGADSDRGEVELMAASMTTRPVVLAGIPIDRAAAIMSRLDMFVCNNSGPLHVAVALGVPTVSVMGPTVEHLWRPVGPGHIVIRHPGACAPCDKPECKNPECLGSITVDEMEKAAAGLFDKVKRR